jgi:hypothetical protein
MSKMMVLCISVEDNYFEYLFYIKLHEIKLKRIYYHSIKKQLNRLNWITDIDVNFSSGLSGHPI